VRVVVVFVVVVVVVVANARWQGCRHCVTAQQRS
jgi:hypothetical protein